jgi:hypothetical protein
MAMRRFWTLTASAAIFLSTAPAWAQSGPAREGQPQAGFVLADDVYEDGQDSQAGSPSDDPMAQADAAAGMDEPVGHPSCGGCGGCSHCCGSCDSEPWRLFGGECLAASQINIQGWIAGGYTWNPDNPANNNNFPLPFNDRANDFQLNQVYLILERTTDTGGCGFDIGGRVDLLYGTDYWFTTALGLETERDGTQKWNRDVGPRPGGFRDLAGAAQYGLAMRQMYAQFALNDLTVKAGHFYTPAGYEVVGAPGNFFYSHAYTHQYGEPFTHTGVLATQQVSDRLSVSGGVTRGWDNWEDTNDSLSGIGGFTLSSPDGGTSLAFYVVVGDEPGAFGAVHDARYYQGLVFTHKFTDQWTYVLVSDFGHQEAGSVNVAGGTLDSAQWYGACQYLFYQINDCWKAGLRAEWFRDEDNFRVLGVPLQGIGLDDDDYFDVSLGLNWQPHPNLTVRPEARWDWGGPALSPFGLGGMFDDLSDRSQFTVAVDAIVTW